MDENNTQKIEQAKDAWQQEVLARHRWGQHGEDRAQQECDRIGELWLAARPISDVGCVITEQIVSLEICNWRLEEGILHLCSAIGSGRPAAVVIGHMGSFRDERWMKVWAYYLSLRDWLIVGPHNGCKAMLRLCDPDGAIQNHVRELLREKDELKELYVERFCLCLECWVYDLIRDQSREPTGEPHREAISAVEEKIRQRDPDGELLKAFHWEGNGKLNPCHHKLFRRYDIILSSIGVGKWRGAIPQRGTDGLQRAADLAKYLSPIESWLGGESEASVTDCNMVTEIGSRLGNINDEKRFLATLLVSLLRSQQLSATQRAQRRTSET